MCHKPENVCDYLKTVTLIEKLYGVRFQIFLRSVDWEPLEMAEPMSSDIAEQLVQAFDPEEPVVHILPDQRSLIIVPIETPMVDAAAVAVTDIHCEDLLERITRITFRLFRQQDEVLQQQVLFNELSALTEECNWLRTMSQYIDLSNASQPVNVVVERLLPRLQEMVKARAIGFVAQTESELHDFWHGDVGTVNSRQLIEKYGPQSSQHPVVVHWRDQKEACEQTQVSLVLARIASTNKHYGWLLAIYRQQTALDDALTTWPSKCEFGAAEAGLLKAAAALLATHSHNVESFRDKDRLLLGVIKVMTGALDARDPHTKGHSDRVALYARQIAQAMGLDKTDCERIYLTGLVHDIGKIGMPDTVLNKPGKLSDSEQATIQEHPSIGYDIMKHLEELEFVLPGVLHHHERADGKGYPDGLQLEEMPLVARILGVADAYDAMTSSRSHRSCMSFENAEEIVRENTGTQFAPDAAAAFFRALPQIRKIAEADTLRRLPFFDQGKDPLQSIEATLSEIDQGLCAVASVGGSEEPDDTPHDRQSHRIP